MSSFITTYSNFYFIPNIYIYISQHLKSDFQHMIILPLIFWKVLPWSTGGSCSCEDPFISLNWWRGSFHLGPFRVIVLGCLMVNKVQFSSCATCVQWWVTQMCAAICVLYLFRYIQYAIVGWSDGIQYDLSDALSSAALSLCSSELERSELVLLSFS